MLDRKTLLVAAALAEEYDTCVRCGHGMQPAYFCEECEGAASEELPPPTVTLGARLRALAATATELVPREPAPPHS